MEKRKTAEYDPRFAAAMTQTNLDEWMNAFLRWVSLAKLGGSPAPVVKVFAVNERAWSGYYALSKWAPPPASDLTLEEWSKVGLWPFYIYAKNLESGERASLQQRIEMLSQVMPSEEQHRIEAFAMYDAIFFVQIHTDGNAPYTELDTRYLADQCTVLLEAWNSQPPRTLFSHVQAWYDEYERK